MGWGLIGVQWSYNIRCTNWWWNLIVDYVLDKSYATGIYIQPEF